MTSRTSDRPTTGEPLFRLCGDWHVVPLTATYCEACGERRPAECTIGDARHRLGLAVLGCAAGVVRAFMRRHELSGDTAEERAADAARLCGASPEGAAEPGVSYRVEDGDLVVTSWVGARDSDEWGDLLVVGPTVRIPIPGDLATP